MIFSQYEEVNEDQTYELLLVISAVTHMLLTFGVPFFDTHYTTFYAILKEG